MKKKDIKSVELPKVKKPFFSNKTNSVLLLFCIAIIFTLYKFFNYSADPTAEKNCEPIKTNLADTSLRTIQLSIENPFGNLAWKQKGGTINDASCLNRTNVYGIIEVRSEDDLEKAVTFARDNKLHVSIAGAKHSMGGHAFSSNGVVLDITKFNKIQVNETEKTMTVQSGATWHDIQNVLHPKYSVKAMQSTDIFTVGGSISVNAHGMDHRAGSVGQTVRRMKVLFADGTVQQVTKESDPELFNLIVGGYGLFGVILEAELDITENEVYAFEEEVLPTTDFIARFNNQIKNNDEYGLFYAHLSTAPSSFLDQMILYKYKKRVLTDLQIEPLTEVSNVKLRRFIINFSKTGTVAKELKWFAEKKIEPLLVSCTVNRNQALKEGESCLVSRNEPMHDSVPYLKNNLKQETDILQEYFIPQEKFPFFVAEMKTILKNNNANVLNASVRVVQQEDNFLNYAPQENMFAIVLYLNQKTTVAGSEEMAKTAQQLIHLTNKLGGRFFLPYQLNYTHEQLTKSYPEIKDFFIAKKKYDPQQMFTNKFYEKYST